MYQICYDAQTKDILYTSHTINAPSLLNDYLLEKEILKKPPGGMKTNKLSHISEIDFEFVKSEFEHVKT